MISKLYIFETDSLDPYHNLAMEEYLLDTLPYDSALLYFWQNERTVVIGRNQSSDNEVNIETLEADGGHLARRLSGGGAVYHDTGNLNFTFIVNKKDFDRAKQDQVIMWALDQLGIHAEVNGRNDLVINGCKFSGHAYYHGSKNSYHHGTIMVDVNNDDLVRYLNVSKKKLTSKKVESVRSRVINLKDVREDITLEELKAALKNSFVKTYGLSAEKVSESDLDDERISELEMKFASPEWKYDKKEKYDFSKEQRFKWGMVEVRYSLEDETVSRCCVYTDSLNTEQLLKLPNKLRGRRISEQLRSLAENEEETDVIDLLIGRE
ncbi:MAG: lipoate--protein ligase [Erysipelotrichaceae bacterium]|nr:lipoate--protein ligase [Erysipelotrichaceae bacterium]